MFPRNSGYRPEPLLIVANFPIKEEMFEIINTLFGVNFSLRVPETSKSINTKMMKRFDYKSTSLCIQTMSLN
ncbi:MAG: hypothetical protein AWU59_2276 [Methanolobus sp. T82-4]|jgi:hypothetical protein|nr:MAG: hypothetical protein AWU59_2276 [Methanolobus sp. T82-4]